jgi:hypothetical protein
MSSIQVASKFHPFALPTLGLPERPHHPAVYSFLLPKLCCCEVHHSFLNCSLCLALLDKGSPFYWSRECFLLAYFQDYGHCILERNSERSMCEEKIQYYSRGAYFNGSLHWSSHCYHINCRSITVMEISKKFRIS